ncbi:copper chaperone CopZ [Cytobacillus sp. Hz8]|uniref:copper chaperone CopZ n=1 Tax=Cytobacillus sp. Hz8 TaxID=3347168 RepID=UPI0035E1DA9B
MDNILLKVSGMSCGHCVKAVEGSVGALSGVEKVTVSLEKGEVQVEFNPEAVSIEKIKETIDDQGYDVA